LESAVVVVPVVEEPAYSDDHRLVKLAEAGELQAAHEATQYPNQNQQ